MREKYFYHKSTFAIRVKYFLGLKNRAREQAGQAEVYGDFRLLTRAVPRLQKHLKSGIV
jgi:hypothetical protein